MTTEKHLEVDNVEQILNIFGNFDSNIKIIENHYNVHIVHRGTTLKIAGEESSADKALRCISGLIGMTANNENITEQNVRYAISMVEEDMEDKLYTLEKDIVCITSKGRPIKAKTLGQKKYIDAISHNTITFGIGPAGTGKTYLAVAMAVTSLKKKEVSRIVITRPAVEAGESLGFLPGDLQEKVDPYLRPLYDALFEMLGGENFTAYQEKGMIEVAPLAYMRGRTLDRACVILDEAQNTNLGQLKMFLTRMGCDAKFIVTGDASQIDLPNKKDSGLIRGMELTKNIKGVKSIIFKNEDIVRHPLVAKIVKAFDKAEGKKEEQA